MIILVIFPTAVAATLAIQKLRTRSQMNELRGKFELTRDAFSRASKRTGEAEAALAAEKESVRSVSSTKRQRGKRLRPC